MTKLTITCSRLYYFLQIFDKSCGTAPTRSDEHSGHIIISRHRVELDLLATHLTEYVPYCTRLEAAKLEKPRAENMLALNVIESVLTE